MSVRVVVDHVAGARRGQRQEFAADHRVQFGRHPDCEVSFDPHKDLDASSRHAELRAVDTGWVLVDLGSSNGTYVDGHRVTEAPLASDTPIVLEFGPGGPRVRLFIGDRAAIDALPPAPIEVRRPGWIVPVAVGAATIAILVMLFAVC